ncbi:MAG TPA: preprotein translocase subunit SecG [Armatimonadota bacterium]|nr:preprotein translocase subunit SecG [Armatimonadota bacterium]
MIWVAMTIASVTGVGLILSVLFQTTTAEGFSASLGGQETSRFQKGSKDEMLDKVCKVCAIVWILSMLMVSIFWFQGQAPSP